MDREYKTLDYHKVLSTFEKDQDMYTAALERFAVTVESAKGAFRHMAETGNLDSIFREALYQIAVRLEKAARAGASGEAAHLVDTCEGAAEDFIRESEHYRHEVIP